DRSASRYEMESLSLTLLAGLTSGPWFFEGALTYSDLDYDELRRSFDLGPFTRRIERADTEGETLGFKFTSGLNVVNSEASYRFGPTWSFEYIDAQVDSFAEREGFLTALRVSNLDSSASILSAGIFADRTLQICDCDIYGELIYRGYIDNDDVDPRIGQVDVPGNSARLPGYRQDDESIHLDVGLEAELSEDLGLNVGGGYKDADNGEAYWLGAELLYTF
ncbi:MAG: autotransporter outer membrane beta-barrel domain-containing protein, partial [Pseudomonadota bacterium]